jgi:predicted deacylase
VREINRITKPFSTYADGNPAVLRMVELVGEDRGPLVGIVCGVHGNEISGPQAALELFRFLSNLRLKGRILILPVANMPGFVANRRFTPLDDQNLNREFPGNENGTHTQQMAFAITREFLDVVDVHIDLHSGGHLCAVDYVAIFNNEGLSRSFGSKVLYRPEEGKQGTNFKGMTFAVTADRRNIPTVGIELGGGTVDQGPYVERYVQGVLNMLRHLGLIPGEELGPLKQIVISEIGVVRPKHGGWIETHCPPNGEIVVGGQALGQIVSPYTFEVLEQIYPTFEKSVMLMHHPSRNLVQPGEYGFLLGNMDGATE